MGAQVEVKAVKKADKTAVCELPKDTAKIILVVLAVLMANV
jgi:hypothetical protein